MKRRTIKQTEQLHQIKVNIPASEDDYKNGNGEGCWAEVDDKTYSDYLRDERGGQYVGKLLNQPSTDLHDLQYGDYFVFEMRGEGRPVATMDQDTRVIIRWITSKR
jgi:hypothetical protein